MMRLQLLYRSLAFYAAMVGVLTGATWAKELSPVEAAPPRTADGVLREKVRTLVQKATERMNHGAYAEAAALLEEARRLRPDPSLDYNLGIAYADFANETESAQAFARFLQSADSTRFLPERIADARQRLTAYEHSLARLRAHVTLPDGIPDNQVALSVNERAPMPLPGGVLAASLWLTPGTYRLKISGPGLREHQVAVDLGPGEQREVMAEMYRAERVGGLLDQPVAPRSPPARFYRSWWFWTVVGAGTATAVALAGAGAAGAFTHVAPGTDLSSVDLRRVP